MPQFMAKERNPGEPCFVHDEESEVIYELHPPADLAHAERVAEFLEENVRETKVNSNSLPPTGIVG